MPLLPLAPAAVLAAAPERRVPRLDEAGVVVDGRPDDDAWAGALVIEGFRTAHPVVGEVPAGGTTVRLLADDRALYVLFEARDPEPDKVRAWRARRDEGGSSDWVGLYLDAEGRGERAFWFAVTAGGVQMDGVRLAGSGLRTAWDGTWSSAARRTGTGYCVEMRIPWRILRHPETMDRLGLVLQRAVARSGERSTWPALDPAVSGLLVQEAVVGGPGRVHASTSLSITPELAWAAGPGAAEDPRPGLFGVHPGLTLRYAPSPDTVLFATANPDFSEVEGDGFQVEVNRRYPVRYPEKRPFFTEGVEWFDHPWGEVLYTRSIAAPLYGLRATTAARGWTVAALHALDGAPPASVSDGEAWTADELAGHDALATVIRGRRLVGEDGYVGLIASDRTVLGTSLYNRLAGPDARLRLSPSTVVSASLLGAQTRFADRTTGLAPAGSLAASYSGDHPFAQASLRYTDADFRAENGWLVQPNRWVGSGSAGWEFRPGGAWVPYWTLTPARGWLSFSPDGVRQGAGFQPGLYLGLGNGGGASAWVRAFGDRYEGAWLDGWNGGGSLWGDWTRWLAAGGSLQGGDGILYDPDDPRVGRRGAASGWLTVRPARWLSLRQSVSWEALTGVGEGDYAGTVGRFRAELYLPRDTWLRGVVDWSRWDGETERSAELLAAWEHGPGRALYVGGRGELDEGGALASWTVSAKATWTLVL